MMKRVLFGIVVLGFAGMTMNAFSQKNNSSVVKIIEPSNKSKFDVTSQVHYRIKISDKEDGESEYGEIATNEVFLEVRYLPDASKVSATATADPNGLATMKKSNCFNCHAFNGKLIAPSFYEITKRYPPTSSNIELLTKRIREGSGGLWGTASMPSHAELTNQQAEEIVTWILNNGEDPNLNYYLGIEGTFKVKKPDLIAQKSAYVLSATYSDHGGLTSKDVIMVMVK
jgi:cytochrome c